MSREYSAIEAAKIIADSGTAPKEWCDYVYGLALRPVECPRCGSLDLKPALAADPNGEVEVIDDRQECQDCLYTFDPKEATGER